MKIKYFVQQRNSKPWTTTAICTATSIEQAICDGMREAVSSQIGNNDMRILVEDENKQVFKVTLEVTENDTKQTL